MSSFDPKKSFEHIDKLSYEIGPRSAGTEGSREASEYIKEQFEEYGLETDFQDFEFVDKISQARTKYSILIFVFLLAPLLNFFLNWIAVTAAAVIGYGLSYYSPRLISGESSRNVTGTLKPTEKTQKKILIGAHYDSAPCTKGRGWTLLFRALLPPLLSAFLALAVLGSQIGFAVWMIGWIILSIPFLFTFSIPLWIYEDSVSPGANDNASGISILLETARNLSETKTQKTEVSFVAFGGEEQGLFGSKEFSKKSDEPDMILNIDSVGGGDNLAVIKGNGALRKTESSQEINEKIVKEWNAEEIWAPFSKHDHIPFSEKKEKATTLTSFETGGRTTLDRILERIFGLEKVQINRHSKIHSLEDLPEEIKLENIEKSGQIVLDLIEKEDGGF